MHTRIVVGEEQSSKAERMSGVSYDDEIALREMANLSTDQTGVDGVIHISTRAASHAPRIKWYPGRPKENAPCLSVTIEPVPQAFNHHLAARVFDAASIPAKAWVALNRAELLEFWNNGNSWMDHEVDAFKKALKKIA